MIDAGKQVFVYFSEKALSPSNIDLDQYRRVKEFKKNYYSRGLCAIYNSSEDFQKQLNLHLYKYFITDNKLIKVQDRSYSLLHTIGFISKQQTQEKEPCLNLAHAHSKTLEQFEKEIEKFFLDISLLNVTYPTTAVSILGLKNLL